jgi:hypothetical protein
MLMVSVLFWLLVVAWLARWALGSWHPGRPALQPHYEAEVARLREEVDQLGAQLAQLTEEQQFMMRLLTEGRAEADAAALPRPPQPENP